MNIVEMDEKRVPLSKMYLSMAMPVVLSMVTTMVYSVADTWFISATGSTGLIAGVSLNAPVLTLLMAFGNIYGQGGSTLVSRLIGQRNTRSVREVSSACFWLAVATGIVIGAVMLIFRTPILYLLGASEETIQYAAGYYVWIAVGAPFIVLSFIPRNILRSEGMSRESMVGSVGGSVLNIILDPILIFAFGLGAGGAAIATVLGYVFTDAYSVAVIRRRSKLLSVSIREAKTSRSSLAQIFGIGIPAAVTNIMQSISAVLVNQFLLPYGTDQIAAMGIALKVALVGQLILVGMTFGSLPLFAYYFGGENRARFRELLRFCMRVILVTAAVLTAALFAAAPVLIRFFVEDAGLISAGTLMLRLQVISFVFVGVVLLLTIVFQSMGRAKEMLFLSVSRQGIVFLAVLLIASALFGYYGVIAAQAAADAVSAVLAVLLWMNLKRRLEPSGSD